MSLDILRAELALFVEFDPATSIKGLEPGETFISTPNVTVLLKAVEDVKNAPKQVNGSGKPTVNPDVVVSAKLKAGDQTKQESVALTDIGFYAGFAEQAAADGLMKLPGDDAEVESERKPRQSTRVKKESK